MEIVLTVLTIVGWSLAFLLALKVFKAKRSLGVVLVEEYRVESVDKNGVQKTLIHFHDGYGEKFSFEFHPVYAHSFADEIVKVVAKNLPKRA